MTIFGVFFLIFFEVYVFLSSKMAENVLCLNERFFFFGLRKMISR